MNNYEIINKTNMDIKEIKELRMVLDKGLEKEKIKNAIFNVILINDDEIRKINNEYRHIDRVTDVITFALEDNKDFPDIGYLVLGDIYISIDKAKSQALEYGHSFKRELCFLAIHGFYHLLGYDHMTKEDEAAMFARQESVLSECQIQK